MFNNDFGELEKKYRNLGMFSNCRMHSNSYSTNYTVAQAFA